MEVGFFKAVEIRGDEQYKDRQRQFGMLEPQPLAFNNVMFPFIFLCLSITVALAIGIMEVVLKKFKNWLKKVHPSPKHHMSNIEDTKPKSEELIEIE